MHTTLKIETKILKYNTDIKINLFEKEKKKYTEDAKFSHIIKEITT